MNRTFFLSLILGVMLLLVIAGVIHALWWPIPLGVWILIALYPLLTLLLFRMVAGARDKSPARFVATVNGTVITKLFVSALIAGTYFYFSRDTAKVFALSLMVVYLVNTVVFIRASLKMMRETSK
jgi:hypothetical protein